MQAELLPTRNRIYLDNLDVVTIRSLGVIGPLGAGKGYYALLIAQKLLSGEKLVDGKNFYKLDIQDEQVGIAELRELQKQLHFKNITKDSDISRVVVIEHFNLLKTEAQNSMLKTLEEPPSGTLIILTIDDTSQVIGTIFSRLDLVTLDRIDLQSSLDRYATLNQADIERNHLISGGLIGLQHALIENSNHALVDEINRAKEILRQDRFGRLSMVDKMSKEDRASTIMFLDGLIKVLSVIHKQNIAKAVDTAVLKRSIERLELCTECQQDVANGLNQKLALTRLFISL